MQVPVSEDRVTRYNYKIWTENVAIHFQENGFMAANDPKYPTPSDETGFATPCIARGR